MHKSTIFTIALATCFSLLFRIDISQAQTTQGDLGLYSEPATHRCGYDAYQAHYRKADGYVETVLEKSLGCGIVQLYYVLPTDAERTDRADICQQAVEHIRQNWAAAGRSFEYTDIQVIHSPYDQEWWRTNPHNFIDDGTQVWEYLSNLEYYLELHADFKYLIPTSRAIAFIELKGNVSAYGGEGGLASIPEWGINGIEVELAAGGHMGHVGVVGHELGHAFGMPHRDCENECSPRSVMCQGPSLDCDSMLVAYPNVALSADDLADLDDYPFYFEELSGCTKDSITDHTCGLCFGPDHVYKITARHSGKALDATSVVVDGVQCRQNEYTGVWWQHWYLEEVSNGVFKIKSLFSEKVLTHETPAWKGTHITISEDVGDSTQLFTIEPINDEGHFIIRSLKSLLVVDVSGISYADGAGIHLWNYLAGGNQEWLFELADGGDCEPTATDGIAAELEEVVQVYPNPFSDHLNIEVVSKGEWHFEIYASDGRLLLADRLEGQSINPVWLGHLQGPQLLFVKVHSLTGVKTFKVLKGLD